MIVGQVKQSARGMTTVVCAMVALAGAALPGGCREDPAALQAVKKASHSINVVAGGAEAAVASDWQDPAFKKALGELASVKLDASNPLSSAVGILTSASQLGSSGLPTQAAQASLSTLSGLRSELRSMMSQWSSLNAIADAAKYDAAPRLAELDAQLAAAKGERQQAEAKLEVVRSSQDAMMASAKDKASQAAKFEQDSVKLREESRRLKASDAQSVLARALDAKRQCDELRLELAKIEADATLLEPKKLGLNQRLQELEIGILSVEAERARVVNRGTEAKVVESQSRAKAAESGAAIEAITKQIAEEREKNLGPSLEEVVAICSKAAASAAAARGDGSQQSNAMFGAVAKHRLGEVLVVRSVEANEYAALMNELAELKPALAGQASFAEAAKAALELGKSSKESAKEALEGARTGYKGLKVKGDADQAAQLEVIKYLTKIGGLEPDDAEAAPATDAAPADGVESGGTPKEAADGPEAEIRGFLADLSKAAESGDGAALASKLHIEGATPEQISPMAGLMSAFGKLDKACKAKFDVKLTESMGENPVAGGVPKMPSASELESAKIEVTGDSAKLMAEDAAPVVLKKVDGSWKWDLSEALGKPEMLAGMGMMGEKLTKAIGELADEVDADTYGSVQEVQKALMSKLMGGLGTPKGEDAGGGGKGGGGGGG